MRTIGLPGERAKVGFKADEMASLVRNWHRVGVLPVGAFAILALLSAGAMVLNRRNLRPAEPLLWALFFLLARVALAHLEKLTKKTGRLTQRWL